jgi:hypothetical protein
MKQFIHRTCKKVGVFEVGKHEKVDTYTHDHTEPFPGFALRIVDQVPQVIIGKGGKKQDQEKEPRSFPVKKEAGAKKKGIPEGALPVDP